MSTDNNAMFSLLQKQEQELKDLAASAYKAWHTLRDAETVLLTQYDGKYEEAPDHIQKIFDKGRAEYRQEWGSDGVQAMALKERHKRERGSLVSRYQILDGIRQSQSRQRNKDQDRERG